MNLQYWFFSENYIYGDNGVLALHVKTVDLIPIDTLIMLDSVLPPPDRGSGNMYYIHTDHLGSYCALTDANKNTVQRNFFDAWGNVIEEDTSSFAITHRGFTGHEHYPGLKIINMNGRLYDPVIGRFFSPDTYVQNPGFTQSYNRYSYCLNNPLKYIDPTGQWADGYDYYDDDDDDYDDDGGPRNPWGRGGFAAYLVDHYPWKYKNSSSDNGFRFGSNDDADYDADPYDSFYNDPLGWWNDIDPFDDLPDKSDPPPPPPSRGGSGITHNRGGGGWVVSLGATMWGEAAKSGANVSKAAGEAQAFKFLKGVSKTAGVVGYVGNAASIGVDVYNLSQNQSAENWAKLGVNLVIVMSNGLNVFFPGVGTGVSLGLGAIEANGGFDWFYNKFK